MDAKPSSDHGLSMAKKNKLLVRFGNRVREVRESKELSQEAFADLCDLDRTYVSGVERGVRNISLINIHKIAQSLDLSAAELMEGV